MLEPSTAGKPKAGNTRHAVVAEEPEQLLCHVLSRTDNISQLYNKLLNRVGFHHLTECITFYGKPPPNSYPRGLYACALAL